MKLHECISIFLNLHEAPSPCSVLHWKNAYLDWWEQIRLKPEGFRMWWGGSWHHGGCWITALGILKLILQYLIPWEVNLFKELPKKESWILSRGLKPTKLHFKKENTLKGVQSSCIVPISITKEYLSHLTHFYPILHWTIAVNYGLVLGLSNSSFCVG